MGRKPVGRGIEMISIPTVSAEVSTEADSDTDTDTDSDTDTDTDIPEDTGSFYPVPE